MMLGRDSEDENWSIFVFELVIWTQPSGPLCLWQCFNYCLFQSSTVVSTRESSLFDSFQGVQELFKLFHLSVHVKKFQHCCNQTLFQASTVISTTESFFKWYKSCLNLSTCPCKWRSRHACKEYQSPTCVCVCPESVSHYCTFWWEMAIWRFLLLRARRMGKFFQNLQNLTCHWSQLCPSLGIHCKANWNSVW